jgi:hypothetical protein
MVLTDIGYSMDQLDRDQDQQQTLVKLNGTHQFLVYADDNLLQKTHIPQTTVPTFHYLIARQLV